MERATGFGYTGATGPTGAGVSMIPGTGTKKPVLVMNGGEIVYRSLPSKGIIVMDANNVCWQITVNTSGNITTQAVACP